MSGAEQRHKSHLGRITFKGAFARIDAAYRRRPPLLNLATLGADYLPGGSIRGIVLPALSGAHVKHGQSGDEIQDAKRSGKRANV